MPANDCPAADAADRISDAIQHPRLIAARLAWLDSARDRAPLQMDIPSRRIPRITPLEYLVALVVLIFLLSSLLGCGAPAPRAGSPSSAGAVGAALPKQIDALGARLQRNRERIAFWNGVRFRSNPAIALRETP